MNGLMDSQIDRSGLDVWRDRERDTERGRATRGMLGHIWIYVYVEVEW